MKIKGIIPELKMSEGKHNVLYHLSKMKDYPILSINTSSLFDGELDYLKMARKMYPDKYLIRKDFIMVPLQIKESKEAGADAVLLIRNLLSENQYYTLIGACKIFKIEPITELGGSGIRKPLGKIVLINSRDLNIGEFDKELAKKRCTAYKSAGFNVIYASGENSNKVVEKGIVDAVLIGTSFMKGKMKNE